MICGILGCQVLGNFLLWIPWKISSRDSFEESEDLFLYNSSLPAILIFISLISSLEPEVPL